MSKFGFLATPTSITFTNLEGKTQTVTSSHENFLKAKEVIKEILKASQNGLNESNPEYCLLFGQMENLIAPVRKITESGDVKIVNGILYYQGEPLHNALTERILWGISEGYPMQPYVNFLSNLMQNPSHRSVEQLFTFIETHKMGITDDGFVLGYKRVTDKYLDLHTKTIDNSPGQRITMPRNKVSDDPRATCSFGLHFCAMSYLPSFGNGGGNKIVIVKVNPKDVVSIPADHNAAKVRCCEYLVLSEYLGDDKEDLLASRPVFTREYFVPSPTGSNDDETFNEDEWDDSEDSSEGDDSWQESEEDSSSEDSSDDENGGPEENVQDIVADVVAQAQEHTAAHWSQHLRPAVTTPEPVEPVVEAAPVAPVAPVQDSASNLENLLKGL